MPKIIKNLELVKEPTGFESWMIVKQDNMFVIGDAGLENNKLLVYSSQQVLL